MRFDPELMTTAAFWALLVGLLLGVVLHLLVQPEPRCPRGRHFVYPVEDCVGSTLEVTP